MDSISMPHRINKIETKQKNSVKIYKQIIETKHRTVNLLQKDRTVPKADLKLYCAPIKHHINSYLKSNDLTI